MNYLKRFSQPKAKNLTSDHLKLDMKGQQIKLPENFTKDTFREQLAQSSPARFNSKTRFRIWGYFGLFVVYIYLISKLLKHRLKADDLEIMEREIKEEWEIKRKIKEINDGLKS